MKYILAGIDIALLLAAVSFWISGKVTKRDPLKQASHLMFGLWVLLDIILMIIAFPLGWYK